MPGRFLYRTRKGREPAADYPDADWVERDNFDTEAQAEGYRRMLERTYSRTPYRIIERGGRYVVEFVPEHKLHDPERDARVGRHHV